MTGHHNYTFKMVSIHIMTLRVDYKYTVLSSRQSSLSVFFVFNILYMTKLYFMFQLILQDTRQKLTQLSSVHSLLKKLQFLFRLPFTLKQNLEDGNYSEAVRNYSHAQRTLLLYQETPSFQGIQSESLLIIGKVKERLSEQLHSKEVMLTMSHSENPIKLPFLYIVN